MAKLTLLLVSVTSAFVFGVVGWPAAGDRVPGKQWTDKFAIDESELGPTSRNPYFVLEPGNQCVHEDNEHGKPTDLMIAVLNETREIDHVETPVLEERETENGQLIMRPLRGQIDRLESTPVVGGM